MLPALLAACASEPPPAPEKPRPAGPTRRCVLMIAYAPAIESRCDGSVRRQVKGAVSKSLVDSGEYELLETDVVAPFDAVPSEARRVADRVGASHVALLRVDHFDVETHVHHVRRYRDGSASGELLLIDGATGVIEKAARETVYLSTRAHYASPDYARDLLLTRLARKLASGLMGV